MLNEVFEKNFENTNRLDRAIYKDCSFIQCELDSAKLMNCEFIDCSFISCNLSNSDFSQTSLKTVIFEDCKLIGIQFQEANPFLLKVYFKGCNLNYSSFYSLNLTKTQFENCELQDIDFTETNLSEAVLSNCSLNHSVFDRTNLSKADLSSAREFQINPSTNVIKKARFTRENIHGLLSNFDVIIS